MIGVMSLLVKAAPTPAQAEAGNYKMKHRRFAGMDISIETPTGTVRRGTDADGSEWETTMLNDYGYIRGSCGVDGDHVDCYLGPNQDAPTAYVVHQRRYGDWDKYDEDKVMLGFDSEQDAVDAYLKHYDDPRFLGPVTAMPVAEFREKVAATKEAPKMIKSILIRRRADEGHRDRHVLLVKAHISGYTNKNGTYVAPHEDKRSAASQDAPAPKKAARTKEPEPQPEKDGLPFDLDKIDLPEGEPIILFHDSPTSEKITIREREYPHLFGGIFAGPDAGMGAENRHVVILDPDKVLTQHALDYDVDYDKASEALRELMPWIESDDDFDLAWSAVAEDKGVHDMDADDMERIFREDSRAHADWEAQHLRGELAKKLGYQAVDMQDETGLSTLVLPGTEVYPLKNIERGISEKEATTEAEDAIYDAWKSRQDALNKSLASHRDYAFLVKSHVKGYTRKDGTYVREHEDKRQASVRPPAHQMAGDHSSGEKSDPTETPQFKKWFGDSKVVDDDGKPLVVYHGSSQSLETIEPDYDEPGAWFTTSRQTAASYAKGEEGVVHSVYLSIQKPFVADFTEWGDNGGDGPITIDGEEFEDNVSIVKYAKRKGYDGVQFPVGNFTEDDETWVVAFEPEQIKSATDNNGDFDPDSPNMLKSMSRAGRLAILIKAHPAQPWSPTGPVRG